MLARFRGSDRRAWAWCGAILGAALLAGCATTNDRTPAAVQNPMLDDVPLPSGFRLVDDRSVGSTSGKVRIGKYEYAGGTDRTEVARFYKEIMPSAGWALKNESFDRGTSELYFESNAESCVIKVKRETRKTLVVVDVRPLVRGSGEGRSARKAAPPTD